MINNYGQRAMIIISLQVAGVYIDDVAVSLQNYTHHICSILCQ